MSSHIGNSRIMYAKWATNVTRVEQKSIASRLNVALDDRENDLRLTTSK